MSRILCEFRFPTGEVKYGVWCDTADLLVTQRTFTSKEDAEQFRQRWDREANAKTRQWFATREVIREDFPTLYEEPPPVGSLGEQDVTLYVEYGGGIEFPTRVSRKTGWVSGPTSKEQHYDEMRSNDECGWVGFGP